MYRPHIFGALIAVTALFSLSSCSLIDTIFKSDNTDASTAILPQDREQIRTDKEIKTFNPDELAHGNVNGEWAIETVFGQPTVGMDTPFIRFAAKEKRIYGNNGCNVINAQYNYNPADSTMSFSNIASTMRLCNKEGLTDYQINTALDLTRRYTWACVDQRYILYMYDETGNETLTLMHQNFQFLNGTWRVVAIDNEEVDVEAMKLVIDVDEGKLHGNTGCNVINGQMEIDMAGPNSISFQAISMTQSLCPDSAYETRLIVALEEAYSARPISPVKVLLLDAHGKTVLTLERT